ncbi:drug/metabolite transporter (DMT)-like permease [Caldalkalibacillus uzonensis]|uniref:Drug/metabolite transporter (DMT)-like permease n=1 Tax=Caldalkalibacillus uzonensis TaxID=353224 RepID=A0ABU0CMP6_9BACI|nr:DMT family transporter [Caldalkalibacillus uzonensis]MDQ0337688.1 drug/metabolite transporter (DMT)-like permease [Caldalkalibacillus uzonensis]
MSDRAIAYFKVMTAMVIVGSSVVAGKVMVQSIPIFIASELRFLVASIILVPLLIVKEGIPLVNKNDLFILFLQSLTGVFLFSIFMLYGLKFTTAMEAGIITSALPAIVALLSLLILKEKLNSHTVIGILFAVSGVLILNISDVFTELERGALPILGNTLIIGAVIGEALFIILGKSVSQRLSPLAISTYVSVFGTILFFPLALYDINRTNFYNISFKEWGLILYFGIIVTVLAFILMYQGIEKIPANKVGVLTSALPISSVILSAFFLKEIFSYYHLMGIGFVLIAIYLTTKEEKLPANAMSK